MIQAIDDEIASVERDPGRSFEVRHGRRLHEGISGSLYTFRAELRIPIAPEARVVLRAADLRVAGTLVAVGDFDVLVHLKEDVGDSVLVASVSTEAAFILEALRDRLMTVDEESGAGIASVGVAGALCGGTSLVVGDDEHSAAAARRVLLQLADRALSPNPAQLRAMNRAAGSNVHFVWGPPGTGKTASLAQITRMLTDRGERVLVLAQANVAVDVAMLRIADALADTAALAEGQVVRVGPAQHPDALRRDEILLDSIVERAAPELALERRELENQRQELVAALRRSLNEVERDEVAADLGKVRERLGALRAELRQEEKKVVAAATVVGATLSRLAINQQLWDLQPDAVLLDEASMVAFSWALAAATRASQRLVVLGDFRQLPPVQVSKTDVARRWLGRDAFDVTGIRARIDSGEDDGRMTMLDTQYRMAAPIGRVVSELGYRGRLGTAEVAGSVVATAGERPWPGESLVVVDTSELSPACWLESPPTSYSRVNPMHVAIALSVSRLAGPSTGVITPYRAQARLLAAGIRDLGLVGASAATTHRFQGSERDVVVFDLVDAPPQGGPSRLTGTDIDLALRLVNVGLSRAKRKAILLVHLDLVRNRLAPTSPVRRAVELASRHGHVVRPSGGDLRSAFNGGEIEWFESWELAQDRLQADLAAARSSILLNVPNGLSVDAQTAEAIAERGRAGTRLVVAGGRHFVSRFEDVPADLRLLPRPGLAVTLDSRTAYIAGDDCGAFVRLVGASLVPLLERMVFDEALAEVEPFSLDAPMKADSAPA